MNPEPQWARWAKALQAIAQNGLTFATNHFDRERYEAVREVAAEILAAQCAIEKAEVLDLFRQAVGYATPKVDVRGAVFENDRILLVREREDGGWTLPGGWADVKESPREAVVREIREESGYETEPIRLIAILDRGKHGHVPVLPVHVYKLFILCRFTGGRATPSPETTEVGFFPETSLPPLSLSRVTAAQVARCFEHHRNPQAPVDFD